MGRALDHAGFLYPKGYLFGLILSTAGGSATFGITAGEAVDSTGLGYMVLPLAYTKTTAAWVLGTGVGALDTGAIANNTWYHVYLIRRPDTGVVDVLYSLSATAPTLPANYTQFRRIGSMRVTSGGAWQKFSQIGDEFLWDVFSADVNAANPGTAAVTRTLLVPTGVQVNAQIAVLGQAVNDSRGVISSLDVSDQTPASVSFNYGGVYNGVGATLDFTLHASIRTNTSAQIRTRSFVSDANLLIIINTMGWIDTRGKLQ